MWRRCLAGTPAWPSEDLAVKGVGDYNQDGVRDLLVLENHRATWSIYLNDGHGHFTRKANAISGVRGPVPPYASVGLAALTDFDNDGIGDLLISCRPRLLILRGTGRGNFTAMNSSWGIADQSSGLYDEGLCFGDIDGDGMLDVIGSNGNLASNPTHFDVYHNALAKKNFLNVRPVGLGGEQGGGRSQDPHLRARGPAARVRAGGPHGQAGLDQLLQLRSDGAALWPGAADQGGRDGAVPPLRQDP